MDIGGHRKAFTLIELLVVMVIIAVLIGLLMPAFRKVRDRALNTQAASEAAALQSAVKSFFLEYGQWPFDYNQATGQAISNVFTTSTRNYNDVFCHLQDMNTKNIALVQMDSFQRSNNGTGPAIVTPWGDSRPYVVKIDLRYPSGDCLIADGVSVSY